jgi:hypothetical protein
MTSKFIVYTDNNPLTYVLSSAKLDEATLLEMKGSERWLVISAEKEIVSIAGTEIKLQIACTDANGNSLVLSVTFLTG